MLRWNRWLPFSFIKNNLHSPLIEHNAVNYFKTQYILSCSSPNSHLHSSDEMMVPTALIQKHFDIFNSWNNSALVFWFCVGPLHVGLCRNVSKGLKSTNEHRRIFHTMQMRSSKTESLKLTSVLDISAPTSHVQARKGQQGAILQIFAEFWHAAVLMPFKLNCCLESTLARRGVVPTITPP